MRVSFRVRVRVWGNVRVSVSGRAIVRVRVRVRMSVLGRNHTLCNNS